jgi:hypothetical protein
MHASSRPGYPPNRVPKDAQSPALPTASPCQSRLETLRVDASPRAGPVFKNVVHRRRGPRYLTGQYTHSQIRTMLVIEATGNDDGRASFGPRRTRKVDRDDIACIRHRLHRPGSDRYAASSLGRSPGGPLPTSSRWHRRLTGARYRSGSMSPERAALFDP